jgi:hypothetical protein
MTRALIATFLVIIYAPLNSASQPYGFSIKQSS